MKKIILLIAIIPNVVLSEDTKFTSYREDNGKIPSAISRKIQFECFDKRHEIDISFSDKSGAELNSITFNGQQIKNKEKIKISNILKQYRNMSYKIINCSDNYYIINFLPKNENDRIQMLYSIRVNYDLTVNSFYLSKGVEH